MQKYMKKKINMLIKLLIATSIFYLILVFNIFHLGEDLVPSTKEYLDTPNIQEDGDLEQIYLEEDSILQEET